MKIQVVIPNPFFTDRGSCIRILGQIKYFHKQQHKVLALSYHSGRKVPGVHHRRTIWMPGYGAERTGASLSRLYIDAVLLLKSIVTNLRFRPDVIHGHLHEGALIGIISSWFRKTFVVLDAEGSLSGELRDRAGIKSRLLLGLIARIERWIIEHVDCVVVSSPIVAADMQKRFGVKPDRINVVPDGIDSDRFAHAASPELRRQLEIPDGKRIVVYAGVLNCFYGIDCLIEAAAVVNRQVTDVHFLIIGYPDVEKYRFMAKERGIEASCTFTGKVIYEEMPRYLALGTLAVAPKLKGTEGTLKLSHYMGAGLPIVAFDNIAHREILGEHGIYAASGDAGSLADALITALRRSDLSETGKKLKEKVVRDYSLDTINGSLERLFEAGTTTL